MNVTICIYAWIVSDVVRGKGRVPRGGVWARVRSADSVDLSLTEYLLNAEIELVLYIKLCDSCMNYPKNADEIWSWDVMAGG